MKNPLAALSRLLSRGSQSPLMAQLYTAAIGQPLLVHPLMGEQLIAAYMKGAIDFRPPTLAIGELAPESKDALGAVTPARKVAVLNVSGGLANRYAGDMCDPGPLSYEMLRAAFDTALADPSIEAIVHRIESPGGMASGLFDYTDHVFNSRGKKPIYAAIDDYAYSAAFAIACACDEVWITRSGGAGSVGAIAYHYDQSGWNSKVGVKVTAIYSGEHKNDGSPHAALAPEVRGWLQERMDAARSLFVDRVAAYRGIDAATVAGTEAQLYQGQAAITIGFADRLGTYADLLAEIAGAEQGAAPFRVGDRVTVRDGMEHDDMTKGASGEVVEVSTPALGVRFDEMPDMVHHWYTDAELEAEGDSDGASSAAKKEKKKHHKMEASEQVIKLDASEALAALELATKALNEAALRDASETSASAPVDINATVLAASLSPALQVALLKSSKPATPETIDGRITEAKAIADICAAAKLDVAADYVARGVDLETARAQLISAVAESGPELNTSHPKQEPGGVAKTTSQTIYDRRAVAAAGRNS